MDLTTLSLDELIALADEKRTRFNEIKALKTPTRAEIAEAQSLAAEFQEIEEAKAALEGAEPATEEETAALAELSLDAPESEGDEEEDPDEEPEVEASAEEAEEEGEPEVEAAVEPEPEAKPAKKVAAAVAPRPAPRPPSRSPATARWCRRPRRTWSPSPQPPTPTSPPAPSWTWARSARP